MYTHACKRVFGHVYQPLNQESIVMAYIVTAYLVMAYIVTAYLVMAYIVTACIVMDYTVMAYIVTAYLVMAWTCTSHSTKKVASDCAARAFVAAITDGTWLYL